MKLKKRIYKVIVINFRKKGLKN